MSGTGKLFLRGVADMRRYPLAQLCTLIAVSMVTLLAAVGLLILTNIEAEVMRGQGMARFQIYWKPGADQDKVEAQWADLKLTPGVAELSTFTPRAALAELLRGLAPMAKAKAAEGAGGGNGTAIEDFSWLDGDNPLPATALISFEIPRGEEPEPWMGRMYARLHKLDDVERVTYNPTQLSLATGWVGLARRAALPALGFFALVVGLVVGNTLKLMMMARKDEVEILSLVGAKPWFIRAPLMANGLVQGFLGGIIALLCLKVVQGWLKAALDVPPLFLKIEFLPAWQAVALVLATTLIAGLASYIAARR